jgi:hypothetical protein
MSAYKRIVALAVGMSVVLAFSVANDILTRHYLSAPPLYALSAYVTLGFAENFIMALLIGESLLKKNYKQYLPLWICLFCLDFLSTLFLLTINSRYLCFAASFVCVAASMHLLFLYIKNTRYLGFLMLPVVVWYIYLFLNNYAAVLMG